MRITILLGVLLVPISRAQYQWTKDQEKKAWNLANALGYKSLSAYGQSLFEQILNNDITGLGAPKDCVEGNFQCYCTGAVRDKMVKGFSQTAWRMCRPPKDSAAIDFLNKFCDAVVRPTSSSLSSSPTAASKISSTSTSIVATLETTPLIMPSTSTPKFSTTQSPLESIVLSSKPSLSSAPGQSTRSQTPIVITPVTTTTSKSQATPVPTPAIPTTPQAATPPGPTQSGIAATCYKYALQQGTSYCADMAKQANIPLDLFYRLNPPVKGDCSALWKGYAYCVAGVEPSVSTNH